ncbi:DUF6512 family protein [Vallitalea guaymasensis]|uniref:Uncharacterized protein n=1 Tax=Vallitalea guaymasensis TaxID=1185412 RepID=A0A8J8SDK2_9FIRM|nr:DUF6512 family protein [Vallitalea guaymasensis]QUH30804.1 hypothetical protein HYG85_18505 [Vallitalea guaymasensis]
MNDHKKVIIAEIVSAIAIILVGSLFHFLYEWTECTFIGIFSPVNESQWEHIKIMFYPVILVSIIEYFFVRYDVNNFVFAKAMSVLVFIGTTYLLIFLYECIFGEGEMVLHVVTYIIGAFVGQLVSYFILKSPKRSKCKNLIGYYIFLLLFLVITLFTFRPLQCDFFKDSTTGYYGIPPKS